MSSREPRQPASLAILARDNRTVKGTWDQPRGTSRHRAAQEFQGEQDSGVRIAALHRLAARPEAAVDALASALLWSDLVEQGVVENILLNHPVDEQAVRQVIEVARKGDEAAVRLMVSALMML